MVADQGNHMRKLARMCGSSADATLAMSMLDTRFRPGLGPTEFYNTFTQCACEMVMTWSAFPRHYCRHTVIELTDDSSAAETSDHLM